MFTCTRTIEYVYLRFLGLDDSQRSSISVAKISRLGIKSSAGFMEVMVPV